MIPVLFNKEETTFTSLGLGEIDATVVEVERERNGIYSLYMELPFSSDYVALIEQEMQIKADAGARTKWQTFKVNRVIKDTDKKIVKVYADHISMDTINDAMKPRVAIRQQTAEGALRQWNANRISAKQYDVSSDISTISGTTWTIDEVENARQALGGVEGSILDVWGGEFEFDNNRIILHKEMGREAPTVLEYGRNIVSLEYEELIDGVYTSIYPYASYTPRSEDNRQQEPVMVTLDELIVDGDYVGNYQSRRVQIVDFSSEFDSSGDNPEIPTQTKLRSLAKSYVKTNDVGAPKITQEVDFVDLTKTLDYSDIQVMEEIELNDRVPIFYPNIKITSDVKVTKTVWQPLINQYKKITVSTIGALKSSSLNNDLKTSIKELEKQQKQINNTVPYLINGQGNRIWYTMPDDTLEHKIGDTWFEKNGKYTIMYQWNGSMWEEIINDETFSKELEAQFAEIEKQTQEMTASIAESNQKSDQILEKVGVNTNLISEHKKTLDEINNIKLPNLANEINEVLDSATSMTESVANDLVAVRNTANNALEIASQNGGKLVTVEQTVDDLKGEISHKVTGADVTESLNTFNETVKKQTASQIASSLTGYAKSTDLNGLATESYARTQATTEAGKVRQELTSYAKTNDLTVLAQNIRTETAESLKSVYTKTETNGLLGDKVSQATYESGIKGVRESVTTLEGDIKDLTKGGINLILNSNNIPLNGSDNSNKDLMVAKGDLFSITPKNDGNAYGNREFVPSETLIKGETYTLSFDVATKSPIDVYWYAVTGGGSGSGGTIPNTNGKVIRYSFTYKQQRVDFKEGFLGGFSNLKAGEEIVFGKFKLEKGSISTPWQPAISDMVGQSEFSLFKRDYEATDKLVKERLTAVESTTKGHTTSINDVKKTADGNEALIAKIQETPTSYLADYQKLINRANLVERTLGTTDSAVGENVSRMVQTSGIIQTEVASMPFGGRNLIKNTEDLNGIFGTGYGGSSIKYANYTVPANEWGKDTKATRVTITNAGGTSGVFTTTNHFKMIFGRPYTLSFYVKNLGNNRIQFNLNGLMVNPNGSGSQSIYVNGGESKKVTATGYARTNPEWNWFQILPTPASGVTSMDFVIAYLQVEEGMVASDWGPAVEDAQKQLSTIVTQLDDSWGVKIKSAREAVTSINANVSGVQIKGELINLDAKTTVAQAFWAKEVNAIKVNADNITTGTLDGSRIRANSINTNRLTGNISEFIRTNWNSVSGTVSITGADGILTTAGDGSQTYIKDGIVGTRQPSSTGGGTVGQIGYAYESASPWYSMQVSNGSHFQIRMSRGDGQLNKQAFYIISGGTESYLNTDNIYLNPSSVGRVRVQGAMTVDKDIRAEGTVLVRQKLEYLNGGFIESQSANSNMLIGASNKLVIYTNGSNALEFDANNAVFRRKISEKSDARLKTNIVDMPIDSLGAIRNMEIKKFDYLDGRKNYYGIIAQQAQQYLPELINTDSEGYLMVDKSAMTYVNMHAIQQLDSKVDDEVAQLKAQIASLQEELALLKGA